MSNIVRYYDSYDEWSRLDRHRVEFEITLRVLNDYIPVGSSVLDVGGGPGRYSLYLATKGYDVTLVDLSEKHVNQARSFAKEQSIPWDRAMAGNALHLDELPLQDFYDVVLCMGPLYHLLDEGDRVQALSQCMKRLKPGGLLIVAFISAYAPMVDCLKSFPESVDPERFLKYLDDGRNYDGEGFTDAYFVQPGDIEPFMNQFSVDTIRLMATEGLGALAEQQLNALSGELFSKWMDLLYRIAHHKEILGCCEHLLYIGRKRQE